MIHIKLNADHGDSYLGIWWWTGTEIIGTRINPDDGVLDGHYIQPTPDVTKNHFTEWNRIKATAKNPEEVKDKSYKGLERGRVLYDTMTMCFVVTCSPQIYKNDVFRRAVVDFYNLQLGSTDFSANPHYYVYDENENLTLASFYDNF